MPTLRNFNPALLRSESNSFAIDSREVKAGDVFFALSQPDYKNNGFNGDFEDSHKYIPAAFEKGAVACVARPDKFEEHRELLEKFEDRLLFVDDAILAFAKSGERRLLRMEQTRRRDYRQRGKNDCERNDGARSRSRKD